MVQSADIEGFVFNPEKHRISDYLGIDYIFETEIDPHLACAGICSEQSTAQWKRPGLNEDYRPQYAAKFTNLKIIKTQNSFSYPEYQASRPVTVCSVRVYHPLINFGPRIPNLLSAIAGEGAFYCPSIPVLKITDIHFPETFLKNFPGPTFGIDGLRQSLQVYNRPFFIGVVKPNIGLEAADFAEITYQSLVGGLDIAKDDEMLADAPNLELSARLKAVETLRRKAESETKIPKMFVVNVTDETQAMEELYKKAKEGGAGCVMVNSYFTGMPALKRLRQLSSLPILSHFTGAALFERLQHYGIEGKVFVKLQRLLGADIIVIPGFGPRMYAPDWRVQEQVQACLEPMGNIKPALAVPGGSDSAVTLPLVYQKIGHPHFGFIAGRGVFGHPLGPKAGAMSLHQAWNAIKNGVDLQKYSEQNTELKLALDSFK
ncbi:ribulose 1,5-bisphosphate carboxylase [bacterium]|nr:ribulose 1,5-bisphosphate carboxylase [bacterium]